MTVVAVVVIVVAGNVIKQRFLNKDFIASQIEASVNSHVSIGGIDFSLLGAPANLTLKDVHFTPHNGDEAEVKIDKLSVSVGLGDLIKKHVDVSSVLIRGAKISAVIREDGSNSLEELFEEPKSSESIAKNKSNHMNSKPQGNGVRGVKVDHVAKYPEDKQLTALQNTASDQQVESQSPVSEHADFAATLGRLNIEDSELVLTMEAMGMTLFCTGVQIDLSSIKIDPKQLDKTNSADLSIDMLIKIDSTGQGGELAVGERYGELYLSSNSQTTIFNPVTGNVEPNMRGDISLGDDSWLNTQFPVVEKTWDKLSVLEKVGISVSDLPTKATFGRSKAIAVHYHLGKLTVLKPISIWVGDWEIAATAGAWIQTETDQHMIQAELLASEKSSRSFIEIIQKGADQLPEIMREGIINDISGQVIRDNRILLAVESSGEFSDPKVRPTGDISGYSDSLKKLGKELGKDYLKNGGSDALKKQGKSLLKGLFRKL